MNINNITDEQCRNESLYVKPTLSMQGHMAPLDITFYQYPPRQILKSAEFPEQIIF